MMVDGILRALKVVRPVLEPRHDELLGRAPSPIFFDEPAYVVDDVADADVGEARDYQDDCDLTEHGDTPSPDGNMIDDPSPHEETRGELEVEILRYWGEELKCCNALEMAAFTCGWLDRQREITMRECERICDSCEWPSLAAQPDKEAYGRIAELEAENAKLQEQIDRILKAPNLSKGVNMQLVEGVEALNERVSDLEAEVEQYEHLCQTWEDLFHAVRDQRNAMRDRLALIEKEEGHE